MSIQIEEFLSQLDPSLRKRLSNATDVEVHKQKAMDEMNDYLYNKYPSILKQHYGRQSNFADRQDTLRKFKLNVETNNS